MTEHSNEENKNSNDPITSRLPIAILYLKEGANCSVENTKGWFNGISVKRHSSETNTTDEVLEAIDFIRSKLTKNISHDVIVINGVKDKEGGLLMAKTTGFFSDIYFVENSKQLELINGLYEFAEELIDLKSIARQLDEKIWQCFDALRPQLIEREWGLDKVKEIAKEVENLKYEDSDLIKQVKNLFLTLRH